MNAFFGVLIGVVSMLLMITSIATLVHAFDVVCVLLLGLMLLLIRFLYEKVRIVERAKLEDTSHLDVYTSSRPTVQNVRRGEYFWYAAKT